MSQRETRAEKAPPTRDRLAVGDAKCKKEYIMRRLTMALAGAALLVAVLAATVAAAGPTPSPSPSPTAGTTLTDILDLTRDQIREMRQDGLSLAQIAVKQGIEADRLVQALVARWTERIEVRVANGALTADEAATLRTQVETRALDQVNKTTLGGMQGAAVGGGRGAAGAGAGAGFGPGPRGTGTGDGVCDGTGPHGPGRN
jgi:Spy/CpxP family protein refolding chaperone